MEFLYNSVMFHVPCIVNVMYNKETSCFKIELKVLVVMFVKQVRIFFDDF